MRRPVWLENTGETKASIAGGAFHWFGFQGCPQGGCLRAVRVSGIGDGPGQLLIVDEHARPTDAVTAHSRHRKVHEQAITMSADQSIPDPDIRLDADNRGEFADRLWVGLAKDAGGTTWSAVRISLLVVPADVDVEQDCA